MRVLLAPDSFKGSLTASEVASELARGWLGVDPHADILSMPIADGGEGTLAAFRAALPQAVWNPVAVLGPANTTIEAGWLRLPPNRDSPGGVGVIELASSSGIELLDELHPWDAHTHGFGEAIKAAMDAGVSRLILGIGSSASTDGGSGLLRALGARFLDANGAEVALGARGLRKLARIDLSALVPPIDTLVITDVTNPLLGAHGAAAVFGPQKGLSTEDIAVADAALANFSALLLEAQTRLPRHNRRYSVSPITPGAGAAGGSGFGLLAWGAQLVPGAAAVGELVGLPRAIAEADIVVTGEGAYDTQSLSGKAPGYVLECAIAAGTRAALVAGSVAPDASIAGFTAVQSLSKLAGSTALAIEHPHATLRAAGAALARHFAYPAR